MAYKRGPCNILPDKEASQTRRMADKRNQIRLQKTMHDIDRSRHMVTLAIKTDQKITFRNFQVSFCISTHVSIDDGKILLNGSTNISGRTLGSGTLGFNTRFLIVSGSTASCLWTMELISFTGRPNVNMCPLTHHFACGGQIICL